mmetsp:Transcript_24859/g.28372  ORF Transcript_24859/g.28372 Transcript_24859/m.28372 type:complete len:84 (-) Transcript_24859:44-295(-)
MKTLIIYKEKNPTYINCHHQKTNKSQPLVSDACLNIECFAVLKDSKVGLRDDVSLCPPPPPPTTSPRVCNVDTRLSASKDVTC